MKKKILTLLVAAAVVLGVILIVRGRRTPPARYRTTRVDRGDVTMTVSATGTLSAVITVQVGSQVSGIISKLHADFNSRVKKGQLLAEIDPTPFEQLVDQQRANVENARVNAANTKVALLRQQKMLEQGLAAQADFDNAKAAADSAAAQVGVSRAALAQSETNLKYTKIISPVDGIVVNRAFDVGQTVAASFQAPTLFTIAQDLTKMQVEADTDESDIGRVKVGQAARFTVDAFPDRVFAAKVGQIRLNATVNQNVVTYPVMIPVDNPNELLRPSMTPNVTIEVGTARSVLRVPNAALRFRPAATAADAPRATGSPGAATQGGSVVPPKTALSDGLRSPSRKAGPTIYLLDYAGRLKAASVRVGITDGQLTEIVGGDLKEGDLVVTGLATSKADDKAGPRMRF